MITEPPKIGQYLRVEFKNGTRYVVVHRLFDDAFSAKMLTRAAAKGQHGWLFRYNNDIDMEICTVLSGRPAKQLVVDAHFS